MNSSPPGRRSAFSADNAAYLGQLDFVTRISRAHAIWLDTSATDTRFLAPLVSPAPHGAGPSLSALGIAYRTD